MTDPLNFAAEIAQKAGAVALSYYQDPNLRSEDKKDNTLLTEADLAADRYLTDAFREAFPGDHILSEEMDTTYPADGRSTWIIDPIDGTNNFSVGIHYWGVSIARVVDGWPETAALYFPVINELYTAQRGKGAWFNGSPLKVVSNPDDYPVRLFTCDSRIGKTYTTTIRHKPRVLGAAAYNFCAIAQGLSIVGMETICKVWDIAASWLVLSEAGGAIHHFGEPLFPMQPGKDYYGISHPVLGSVNPELLAGYLSQVTFVKK